MIKERNLIFILASSTIVTMSWIGFAIYHTSVTSTIDSELSVQIQPIAPVFNQVAIKNILNRNETEPTFEIKGLNKRLSPTDTPPEPSDTTSKIATDSAESTLDETQPRDEPVLQEEEL